MMDVHYGSDVNSAGKVNSQGLPIIPLIPTGLADVVRALAPVLVSHQEVQCCYVYGSAASGRLKPDSDVDLAVACSRPMAGAELRALQEECVLVLHRDVDLVDLLRVTGLILRNALRGTCVFCRSAQSKYRVVRELIYDQEDMQPLRCALMERRRRIFAYGH